MFYRTVIDQVAEFNGAERGEEIVLPEQITGRALRLAIPRGATAAQQAAIAAAKARAKSLGITLTVIPF